ncbi:MAG: DUF4292 domain-containing protein [Flavobacteriaceae bacterium]|nr:DUF4292 domain-containing protein [Flavobacteriaceae bacterium]
MTQNLTSVYRILLPIVLVMLFNACKSGADALSFKNVKKLKDSELFGEIDQRKSQFNTLESRLKVRYEDDQRMQNLIVTIRMEKDSLIWMNASVLGISMARAKITPGSVQYYEKLDKTYFDGNFELLSKWLGAPLNFDQLQNLLLGEPLTDLRQMNGLNSRVEKNLYRLDATRFFEDFTAMILLRPDNFKTVAQQISRESDDNYLKANYKSYQTVAGVVLPENLHLLAYENPKKINIDIEYRDVKINQALNLPFKIPSGYKELVFSE